MLNNSSNTPANPQGSITLSLSSANASSIQDAWHYAVLILNRSESTFDGDSEYPSGVRGQLKAYENLLGKLNEMSKDCETWELCESRFWHPCDWLELVSFTRIALTQIEKKAQRMLIDPRTGERL